MEYDYILYVDEAGDPGLKRVAPIDQNGASEWMVLSGVLVSKNNEESIISKIKSVPSLINSRTDNMHFRKLSPTKKLTVCRELSTWPVRIFSICSNKRNMRGMQDAKPQANIVEVRSWFYAWLFRLLLERVTYWVSRHGAKNLDHMPKLKIELSQRGGIRYLGMRHYLEWMKQTFASGVGALQDHGEIEFSVLDMSLISDFPHTERAGLQMSDWVASSVFKAIDVHHTKSIDLAPAEALIPRFARAPGWTRPAGYGIKLMPAWNSPHIAQTEPNQLELFRLCGYPNEWRKKR